MTNVKKLRKQIFGAVILLFMVLLAVGTTVFATSGNSISDSYNLVIQKQFATSVEQVKLDEKGNPVLDESGNPVIETVEIPKKVLAAAKAQTYTFKIEGYYRESTAEGYQNVPFNKEVKLDASSEGWKSDVLPFPGPFNFTVTEITDNIVLKVGDDFYNMSNSSTDAAVPVSSREHEVELRNNATLIVTRPAAQEGKTEPDLWYRVTSRQEDEHTGNFEPLDEVFCLKAGESKTFEKTKSGNLLRAGMYTVKQIAAPDGYQLKLGERNVPVPEGDEGHFHINGNPGILTLTAGGTKGDGATHYYTVERTETEEKDTSTFEKRTVLIPSGESWQLDNLPRGGYTVTEYTIDASEEFTATMTQTETRTQEGKSSALTAENKNSWRRMNLSASDKFAADYIKMVSFGPLYDSNGDKRGSSTSYAVFRYGVPDNDKGTTVTNIKSHTKGYAGNKTVTITEAPKLPVGPNKWIYFTVTGLKSSTAKTIGVKWIEYDEKEVTNKFKQAVVENDITVDERRQLTIMAPALPDGSMLGADDVAYYYTIKDEDGNLVSGITDIDGKPLPEISDRDKVARTVKIAPGESVGLMLPEAGSYTITETMEGPVEKKGFNMKVEGHEFGTSEAGKSFEVEVGGCVTSLLPSLLLSISLPERLTIGYILFRCKDPVIQKT